MTTLNDAILAAVDGRLGNLHACLPGRVEKYDYKTQKADVKPLVKRPYADGAKPLPVISSVPVVWPRGGDASLTFPLGKGDGVLLVFAERSIETWLAASKGTDADPGEPRRFDLSDAIAIPGLNPFTVPGLAEDADSALFKYKDFKVKISKDGKIAIGSGSNEMCAIISDLCVQFNKLCNTLSTAQTPTFIGPQFLIQGPQIGAMSADIQQIKAKIDSIKGSL